MTEGEAPAIEPRDSLSRVLVELARLSLETLQEIQDGNFGVGLHRIRSIRELVNEANAGIYRIIEGRIPHAEPPADPTDEEP